MVSGLSTQEIIALRTLRLALASLFVSAVFLAASPADPPPPPERVYATAEARPTVALPDAFVTTTTLPPTTTTTAAPLPPPTTTTTQAPQIVPEPVSAPPSGYGDPSSLETWDRLAGCETGGTMDWATNTGNGYYGGLQFSLGSWQAVGGTGYPHEASRETQIAMGQRLHTQGGWGHWPGCSRALGYL